MGVKGRCGNVEVGIPDSHEIGSFCGYRRIQTHGREGDFGKVYNVNTGENPIDGRSWFSYSGDYACSSEC